ncbi:GNAT family N-acetyltransferase [Elizabethkingia anophelis]|uniref:Putative acetyltransferase n=1 Tax=Elizabethkingia anophelis NUHP1 TaxID=1338011 RepID=A0A077EL66_9FLAO|nr:GNAT family N-acetyltransferase [Elizabethkingia anophelis]AIL46160.1 Putative acetyltransferase [Elizabethkingia anophelis NUHP1]MBE9394219.1 GNAT family N-acetyltransferase [Elizabethkingia anophelis]MBE9406340.1 GNAT family N-acetyltransferase [Elizabethkingia anophelis]BBQ05602.1 N-acetyltransferase [Elizabethkingia anophelis]
MDKEVIITTIQAADDSALASMIRGVFDEYKAPTEGTVYVDPTTDHLSKVFDVKGSVLFVAKCEDKVVGSCGLYPTEGLPEGHVELVKFYISKEARGTGVGRLFMEKCYEQAGKFGYTHIYLESLPAFGKAISIYEKQGFEQLSAPLGNSGHTGCDIWMMKKII